jgi:hypothetical protein
MRKKNNFFIPDPGHKQSKFNQWHYIGYKSRLVGDEFYYDHYFTDGSGGMITVTTDSSDRPVVYSNSNSNSAPR